MNPSACPPAATPAFGIHEFHSLRIGHRVFRGVVTEDGPRLETDGHSVSLLHAGVARFRADGVTSRLQDFVEGWYVALDGTHPRVPLTDLSEMERERLVRTFGLPASPFTSRRRGFEGSPAFDRLAEWIWRHPVQVALLAHSGTLPEWVARPLRWTPASRPAAHAGG